MLQMALEQQGWTVVIAETGTLAAELVQSKRFDAILLDINLPGMDGFEVLQHVRKTSPETRVIVISGSIGVVETVRAMKAGAHECLPKPFNINALLESLNKIGAGSKPVPASSSDSEMTAVSLPMREVSTKLRSIAKSRTTTVLVTGETGTGKEVVARRLHRCSDRRDKPFVAVNCSAIPASLIESELFGHEKGAFTDARATRKGYFEAAADGSIFLDEIGDLSLELQSKLLRVLQERSFRRVGGTQEIPLQARVIAATNVDLAAAVRQGRFREDLYYRLAVIPIHLLPLRERIDDIIPLAESFLERLSTEMNCQAPVLTQEQQDQLKQHPWPGNVRELRNVIERFVLMEGRLEFVSSTRDLGALDVKKAIERISDDPNTGAISDAERKVIYSLLQKLLEQQSVQSAELHEQNQ
jgi:DNA-binding NtrC family response regulator